MNDQSRDVARRLPRSHARPIFGSGLGIRSWPPAEHSPRRSRRSMLSLGGGMGWDACMHESKASLGLPVDTAKVVSGGVTCNHLLQRVLGQRLSQWLFE